MIDKDDIVGLWAFIGLWELQSLQSSADLTIISCWPPGFTPATEFLSDTCPTLDPQESVESVQHLFHHFSFSCSHFDEEKSHI